MCGKDPGLNVRMVFSPQSAFHSFSLFFQLPHNLTHPSPTHPVDSCDLGVIVDFVVGEHFLEALSEGEESDPVGMHSPSTGRQTHA